MKARKPRQVTATIAPPKITIVSPHFGRAAAAVWTLIETFDLLEESPVRVAMSCALHDCHEGAPLPVIRGHVLALDAIMLRYEAFANMGGHELLTRDHCAARCAMANAALRTVNAHVAELSAALVPTPIEVAGWLSEAEGEADAVIVIARRLGWRP